MSESDRDDGVSQRKVLECMTWAGTGVLWTISGGVPHSLGIMGEAQAQEARGLTFMQISDSIGAVSDLAGDELDEFVQKISAALRPSGPS
jgi:hypothetical protein